MSSPWNFTRISLLGVALAAGTGSALAAGVAPPEPIIAIGTTDIDPTKYDWLTDQGRKALADSVGQVKSGSLHASVFAAGPGGEYWSYRSAPKATDLFDLGDLARQALQSCQFYARFPCFIVAINGKEARDANGGIPIQPSQLIEQPAAFDAATIPFLTVTDQRLLEGYGAEPKAKVMVITPSGGWLWRTGDTVFAAMATADTDCKKNYPNDTCIVYAVNNRVVYVPGAPN